MYDVIGAAGLALLAGWVYYSCGGKGHLETWLGDSVKPVPVRRKRAPVDRTQEALDEHVGRTLRTVREDLKRRQSRKDVKPAKARTLGGRKK